MADLFHLPVGCLVKQIRPELFSSRAHVAKSVMITKYVSELASHAHSTDGLKILKPGLLGSLFKVAREPGVPQEEIGPS